MRTGAFAALALVAFAANSLLCRLALRDTAIDAATFSTIRLASGAAVLLLVTLPRARARGRAPASWASALALALYAVPFSFAYTRLTAGTGALLMFGCVQITMLCAAMWSGERPSTREWVGLALAAAGLTYLFLPGLTAPPVAGAALMAMAGVAWGIYSLRGRQANDPVLGTSANFTRAVPFALIASAATARGFSVDLPGALLAAASGGLASGLGYVIWYAALPGLTASRAALLQLAVPVLTAAAGVVFLSEAVTLRLVVSAVLVLGGVALAISVRTAVFQARRVRV